MLKRFVLVAYGAITFTACRRVSPFAPGMILRLGCITARRTVFVMLQTVVGFEIIIRFMHAGKRYNIANRATSAVRFIIDTHVTIDISAFIIVAHRFAAHIAHSAMPAASIAYIIVDEMMIALNNTIVTSDAVFFVRGTGGTPFIFMLAPIIFRITQRAVFDVAFVIAIPRRIFMGLNRAHERTALRAGISMAALIFKAKPKR